MASHLGKNGTMYVGSVPIAEIVDISVEETVSTVDDTNLGSVATSVKADKTSWSGSANCHYDPSDTAGQGALSVGATVTINYYPAGNTAGFAYKTGSALVTGLSWSNASGSTVPVAITLTGVGALTDAVA